MQEKETVHRNLGFWPVYGIISLMPGLSSWRWLSKPGRLQSDSEVWCCSTDVFNWLEPGNRGQEQSLSWLVQCVGQTYTEIMVKCFSTTLYKWKISWYNQGHRWGCQHKRQRALMASLIHQAKRVLKLYYPKSWILPALGSNAWRAWKTFFHLWPCCLELYKIFLPLQLSGWVY